MTETSHRLNSNARERILGAAAGLFAQFGYNGTSTRNIAGRAEVNEVTIYRHYARKRDLYRAVIERELQKLTLRRDLLLNVAQAKNARNALISTIQLISSTLEEAENVVRLMQYSVLDLNQDLDPILYRYVGKLVDVISSYLEPWVRGGDLRCYSAKSLTLTLIAIVLSHEHLHRVFAGELSTPDIMLTNLYEVVVQ